MAESDGVRVGGILLAAGGSTRMGRPKQLVQFEGSTLLRRAAESVAFSECRISVAVLGAEADRCSAELTGLNIDICVNHEWETGISSSIKAGLEKIIDLDPQIDAVIITLCDQPYITAGIIDKFIAEYRRIRPPVMASEYNGLSGVPALFSRNMFETISRLHGDRGARYLIRSAREHIVTLAVPEAAFDIDSPNDLLSVGDLIE